MTTTTPQDIDALREAYRRARARILTLTDSFERDVGLAALRTEALHTYRELLTTAAGLSDSALAPLKEYATEARGGEWIEKSLDALDREVQSGVKKVLGNLWALLTTGIVTGVLASILDVVLIAAIAGDSVGAFLFAAVASGGSAAVFVLRGGVIAVDALGQAWEATWGWASRVGAGADAALADARAVQTRILQRAAAGGLSVQRLTDRLRSRAKLVMGLGWLAIALAAVLIAIGFYQAATDWWATNPANPNRGITPTGAIAPDRPNPR